MPAPMPLEPPVTRATLSLNDFACICHQNPLSHLLCPFWIILSRMAGRRDSFPGCPTRSFFLSLWFSQRVHRPRKALDEPTFGLSAIRKLTAADRFRRTYVLLHALRVRKCFSRRLIRAKLTGCPCGRSSAKSGEVACGRRELRGWTKSHKIRNLRAHRWNDGGRTRGSFLHLLRLDFDWPFCRSEVIAGSRRVGANPGNAGRGAAGQA